MKILKIMQKDNVWIDVNEGDYEIKTLELKKGKPRKHLIYNNNITMRVLYECEQCGKQVETSWGKFNMQHIEKNNFLCRICTIKSKENREKISKKTKEAMNNVELRNHLSKKQHERWAIEENRIERSKISKEIINRPNMKEFISLRTKEEMNKLDTKKICNPYKNMTEEEKKLYLSNIGFKNSKEGRGEEKHNNVVKKFNETRNKLIKNKNFQNNMINGIRKSNMSKISNNQKIVNNYINKIYNGKYKIEYEYPINLYDIDAEYEFLLIDIVLDGRVAIEVSGNYYHDALNLYLSGKNSKEEIYDKYKDSEFHTKIFKKDLFKMDYLKNNGFKLYYITEEDIINCNFINIIDNIIKEEKLNEIH